jgi:serine/threonine protein kinase
MANIRLLNEQYRLSVPAHIGGMAEIYESRDILTDAKVAIKLFTSGHLEMDVLRESYQRELLALSQLKHQSIVQLLDHGEDRQTGHPFLVLEWVDTDLRRLLQKTVFSVQPDGERGAKCTHPRAPRSPTWSVYSAASFPHR